MLMPMAKKKITREEIEAVIEEIKSGKLNKTKLTIDFMDSYVAKVHPEKIDEWIKNCLSIPEKSKKIGGKEKLSKDVQEIRKYFIATFFPEQTEEAKEAEKERAKKEREAKKAAQEAKKNLSPEELFRQRMNELAEEE